jgi:hypothetical protein
MAANYSIDKLRPFLKAIADLNRIRLIAQLSQCECSAVELAQSLHLAATIVNRHLELLEQAELITPIPSSGSQKYRFNRKKLEKISRESLSSPRPRADLSSSDLDAEQKQILSNYLREDGSLKLIPEQKKRILIVLDYIAGGIRPGVEYSEKEINETLKRFHPDSTTLRRYLIDHGYLERDRDGSRYWRVADDRGVTSG